MNSKLIAGIGIIIVLSAVYVLFFNQKTETIVFSDGITEIDGLWEKNKVNSAFLLNNSIELEFSESDLKALNDDLISFQDSLAEMQQTKDVEALTDFTEIHLLLVDELSLVLKTKKVSDELNEKEINGSNLCLNKTELKLVGENTILLNEKIHKLNELIYAFDELHSGFQKQANLGSFIVDESGFSQTKLENETVLNELERLC